MPRRRRNRNQRRRTRKDFRGMGGNAGRNGKNRGKGDEDETPKSASKTPEGLPNDLMTLDLLNDTLQGINQHLCLNQHLQEEEKIEMNQKINALVSTPPLLRSDNNILNNLTPRRNLRNLRSDSYIDNLSANNSKTLIKCNKIRSNSSTSKLRSPGIEKTPITVDVATQTVRFEAIKLKEDKNDKNDKKEDKNENKKEDNKRKEETLYLESCINIFETPKIPQHNETHQKKRFNIEELDLKRLNLNKFRCNKLKNLSEILFSPNNSEGEISFQNLIGKENVSTPILIGSDLNERLKRIKIKNVDGCVKEKVKIKKFESSSLVMKRRYKNVSPKLKKLENDSKRIPKSFTPPRAVSHPKPVENILNVSNGKLFKNIKRFHTRFVSRWIAKISELCAWLGLSLKKTLTPEDKFKPKSNLKPSWFSAEIKNNVVITKCIDCEEQKMKLTMLSTKIEDLERESARKNAENSETVEKLSGEIAKIKGELTEIETIKKKIAELEENLEKRKITPEVCTFTPPIPPPPPCAPPPPPPPPMMNLNLALSNNKKVNAPKRLEKKTNENSRPVISLDDILKVKLKKTTEKPLSARRPHQPLISVEMLNQIKLRPTSRPETPSSTSLKEKTHTLSMPNSPGTNLSKILSAVDTNVRRIKRLKLSNGYSLDDFSRRRVLRREWSGSDDT